jgi:hypothetical protein
MKTQRELARRTLQGVECAVPVLESQAALFSESIKDASPSFPESDNSLSCEEYCALTDVEDAVRALGKVIRRYRERYPR